MNVEDLDRAGRPRAAWPRRRRLLLPRPRRAPPARLPRRRGRPARHSGRTSPWRPGSTSSARSWPSASRQPVVVLGHSMGTILALKAWAAWPRADPRADLRRRRAAGRAAHPRATVGTGAGARGCARSDRMGADESRQECSRRPRSAIGRKWSRRSSGCSRRRRSRRYVRCCRILLAANAEADRRRP